MQTAIQSEIVPGGPEDVLFTLSEAQTFLRVGRTTLYELLKASALPFSCVGSQRRIWRSDCVAYVNRSRRVGSADAA